MVVRCNHLPVVTGTDKAVWDRIRAVPFTVIIPEHEQDPDFATKIAAAELPGILTWMCAGRRRFVERGNRFDTPKAVLELTEKHRKDSNVFGTWLAECVDIDTKQDKAPYIELQAEVTKCHTEWSRANNHVALSSKNLWAKMREHLGYDPVTRGDHGVKRVKGMRLLRNDMADNLIAHNNKTIDVLEKRLAVADMKEKLRDLRDRKSMADAAEIAQLEDKLEKLQGELARLQGVGGGTTSPTSSGKQRLFVVGGGKK
jgi:phage/plasmid-associated DNA primase